MQVVVAAVQRRVGEVLASLRVIGLTALVALSAWRYRAGLALARGHAGQSMVEYGIVVALIAIVAFLAVAALGKSVTEVFQNIMSKLDPFAQTPTTPPN